MTSHNDIKSQFNTQLDTIHIMPNCVTNCHNTNSIWGNDKMTNNDNVTFDVGNIVPLATFCETNGIDIKLGRRNARKNKFAGAFQLMGRWCIASDAPVPVFADARTITKRTDGRERFNIALNKSEHDELVAMGYEITNPRTVAKQRRDQRKQIAQRDADVRDATMETMDIPGDDYFIQSNDNA